VLFIGNAKTADMISLDGADYNLATADGRQAALGQMALSEYQLGIIRRCLHLLTDGLRDLGPQLIPVSWI
jgi:hypothetical protein